MSCLLGCYRTYRIVGFVCLGANAISCLLVKEKFPSNVKVKGHENTEHDEPSSSSDDEHRQQSKHNQGEKSHKTYNFEVFKNINFIIWMTSGIISTAGYFIPFFFVPCKWSNNTCSWCIDLIWYSLCNLYRIIDCGWYITHGHHIGFQLFWSHLHRVRVVAIDV